MNPTNSERASWARQALATFARLTGQDRSGDLQHDLPSVVGDLLADLMHFCRRQGVDFDACLDTARSHHSVEVLEDEEDPDDLCDLCMTSGVRASRVTYCGKTIGVECGCDAETQDGACRDETCVRCHEVLSET